MVCMHVCAWHVAVWYVFTYICSECVCACVCVCVHVCVCACMQVCVCVCVCIHVNVTVYTCIHQYLMYVCRHVYHVCMHVCVSYKATDSTHTCLCMFVHACMCVQAKHVTHCVSARIHVYLFSLQTVHISLTCQPQHLRTVYQTTWTVL